MQSSMQGSLNWIGHEDLHLALAQVFDVVIQCAKFELFTLRGALRLLESFEVGIPAKPNAKSGMNPNGIPR